jgi:hypothetical protein
MAYQVKWKMISHMHEDKDDWASVEEFKTVTECMPIDFPTAVTDATASYKNEASVWSVESGLVYITATYNSEADYNSSVSDYRTNMPIGDDNVKRTTMEVVSAADV